MVHVRINEREPNPNKHINFISVLPVPSVPEPLSEDDARQLLRALAAQVRPIMQRHGFSVNSLEEYEYNRVFAGRNWNAGETIELVLRSADLTFAPISWLLSTLCHELAHIKHMNHGRDFQRLWAQLRTEVRALQEKGYFGDGYWSSGRRLSDSSQFGGQGIENIQLPEYVCGGAQTRSRPSTLRRRVRRPAGAQAKRKRKPGSRITAKGLFGGEGRALNDDISDEEEKAKGTGFRKQASSKRSRELRALAAERRLKSLQIEREGKALSPQPESPPNLTEDISSDEEDSRWESAETDEQRKQMMKDSMKDDSEGMNASQRFMEEFLAEYSAPKNEKTGSTVVEKGKGLVDTIEVLDDDDVDAIDLSSVSNPIASTSKLRKKDSEERLSKKSRMDLERPSPSVHEEVLRPSRFDFNQMLQDQMTRTKRESMSFTRSRKLGSTPSQDTAASAQSPERDVECEETPILVSDNEDQKWSCMVCTLENIPGHLACMACGTTRGESTWVGGFD